jgi:hypothetical protein
VADLHIWRVGPAGRACIVSLVTHQPRPVEQLPGAAGVDPRPAACDRGSESLSFGRVRRDGAPVASVRASGAGLGFRACDGRWRDLPEWFGTGGSALWFRLTDGHRRAWPAFTTPAVPTAAGALRARHAPMFNAVLAGCPRQRDAPLEKTRADARVAQRLEYLLGGARPSGPAAFKANTPSSGSKDLELRLVPRRR